MTQITIINAAYQLGVKIATIAEYVRKGKLTGDLNTGMVDLDSIRAYSEQRAANRTPTIQRIQAALDTGDLTPDEVIIFERRLAGETLQEIAGEAVTREAMNQRCQRAIARTLKTQP